MNHHDNYEFRLRKSPLSLCIYVGRTNPLNVQQAVPKLQGIFTCIEQLYTGSMYAIKSVCSEAEKPPKMLGLLKLLSTIPERVTDVLRAATRAGACTALARAKAYYPYIEPAELIGGFPAKNLDDSPFSDADYVKVVRETWVAATKIASEIDLSLYQAAYDDGNK